MNNITPEQIRDINSATQEIGKFQKISMQKLQQNDFRGAQMFFSLLSAAAGKCSDTLRDISKVEEEENDDVVSTTNVSESNESKESIKSIGKSTSEDDGASRTDAGSVPEDGRDVGDGEAINISKESKRASGVHSTETDAGDAETENV